MKYIERLLKNNLLESLNLSPIVFLNGPRQAGKSTLVHYISKQHFKAEYVTFDSATQMAAAASSPETYLRERPGSLIIDEAQLVPEIFRALKLVIDELRQAEKGTRIQGRFLLTGSASIMTLPELSKALVGRMHVLTLYPLSGAEVTGGRGDFIERIFSHDFITDNRKNSLIDIINQATFPEISTFTKAERAIWFEGYLTTILQRDVRAIAEIEKLSVLPNLLRILANRAGCLMNDAAIARDANLNPMTTRNYKTLLKMIFLTFELSPWYRNLNKRLVKSPKGYMIDTTLLCYSLQYHLEDILKLRPELFGHVLENFVATELLKLISNRHQQISLQHFRTSDNQEVDFVLEKANGQLVGVEVKNKDQVNHGDFKGLEVLQHLAGETFICGVVLYCGREVVRFGQSLWAVPMSNLFN